MGAADRSNLARVPRCGEPIVNGSTDCAPADRRIAGALMAGNQEKEPLAARDRLLERAIDRSPGAVEAHPVEIDHPVRCNSPGGELAIPACIEGRAGSRLPEGARRGFPRLLGRLWRYYASALKFSCLPAFNLTRERADGRGYPRPESGFFRAERAHGPQRPWALGCKRLRLQPFRRLCGLHRAPSPRRCRSGWVP